MLRPFSEPAPAWQARPFGNTAPAAESIGNRAEGAGDAADPADEAPLTQEELDALALVQNAMDPDVLRKKAVANAGRLYGAMTGKQGETVANKKKKDDRKYHDKTCSQHGKWTELGTFTKLKGILEGF